MYTFVLEWTPALTPSDPEQHGLSDEEVAAKSNIPHGYIFAAFMVCLASIS